MTIQEYFGDWSKIVDLQEADRVVKILSASKHTICPQLKDVFKAFRKCPLEKLKVILLGKDPYPQVGIATGLAFANSPNTKDKDYSPSLEILKESVIDYTIPHKPINFDPSLEKWAEQGVLLLNTALTCEANKIGSHMLLWRPFIKTLLSRLSLYYPGTIYVLMGNDAQSFGPYIKTRFNYVYRIRHPSWYARQKIRMPSDIWKEINHIIIGQTGKAIEWYLEY